MNIAGGTNGVLKGNLKAREVSANVARISPGESGEGNVTVSCTLKGLSSVLNVFVGVGGYQEDSFGNMVALPPSLFPATAGTIQITPQSNFPDRPLVQFRPIFQDPSQPSNENHPLPQALPYSINFPGECDEAVIDIVLNQAAWDGTGITGGITIQVMVEYVGPWWDAQAVVLAIGQVSLTPPGNAVELLS